MNNIMCNKFILLKIFYIPYDMYTISNRDRIEKLLGQVGREVGRYFFLVDRIRKCIALFD